MNTEPIPLGPPGALPEQWRELGSVLPRYQVQVTCDQGHQHWLTVVESAFWRHANLMRVKLDISGVDCVSDTLIESPAMEILSRRPASQP